ncbi:hypothetical protein GMRT_16214 [Giardia muris]|uniref:Uncharacterized protein n=1 Tax=Giardia muris TaxID=5742 RepID=A0A4Z1T5D0_GIAMU|nr:hypothetical protein GMRT_16214 [Giardia muris]|eukprot:TNJ27671.1 hypothetical protein GMRT_16214 [Giardia muris]
MICVHVTVPSSYGQSAKARNVASYCLEVPEGMSSVVRGWFMKENYRLAGYRCENGKSITRPESMKASGSPPLTETDVARLGYVGGYPLKLTVLDHTAIVILVLIRLQGEEEKGIIPVFQVWRDYVRKATWTLPSGEVQRPIDFLLTQSYLICLYGTGAVRVYLRPSEEDVTLSCAQTLFPRYSPYVGMAMTGKGNSIALSTVLGELHLLEIKADSFTILSQTPTTLTRPTFIALNTGESSDRCIAASRHGQYTVINLLSGEVYGYHNSNSGISGVDYSSPFPVACAENNHCHVICPPLAETDGFEVSNRCDGYFHIYPRSALNCALTGVATVYHPPIQSVFMLNSGGAVFFKRIGRDFATGVSYESSPMILARQSYQADEVSRNAREYLSHLCSTPETCSDEITTLLHSLLSLEHVEARIVELNLVPEQCSITSKLPMDLYLTSIAVTHTTTLEACILIEFVYASAAGLLVWQQVPTPKND